MFIMVIIDNFSYIKVSNKFLVSSLDLGPYYELYTHCPHPIMEIFSSSI